MEKDNNFKNAQERKMWKIFSATGNIGAMRILINIRYGKPSTFLNEILKEKGGAK